MKITIVWSMNLPDLSKLIYFLVHLFFYYNISWSIPVDLHFAMIFFFRLLFYVNYCTLINHDLNPKDMNPNWYTNPGKGDIGKYICLTHVTLSSCKTGNPPPPPPPPTHTHTQHYASTQTSITQTQHNTVRIIIFPKHVLIQNLQASIRVEGEGPWPKLW